MSKPAHKIRNGVLQVTIWRNSGEKGSWYSVTSSRSYKQGDGADLDFVRQQHPSTVWTLVDGEDGDMYVHSGLHFVNRIGYLVSLAPVPEGVDIQVHIPMQCDEVDDAETSKATSNRRPA